MLNPDGTFQLDGHGDPIPTYTQDTVNNFTKVFTGWTLRNQAASCPSTATGNAPAELQLPDPMLINAGRTTTGGNKHDMTAKTLLVYPGSTTTNIAACAGTCAYDNEHEQVRHRFARPDAE